MFWAACRFYRLLLSQIHLSTRLETSVQESLATPAFPMRGEGQRLAHSDLWVASVLTTPQPHIHPFWLFQQEWSCLFICFRRLPFYLTIRWNDTVTHSAYPNRRLVSSGCFFPWAPLSRDPLFMASLLSSPEERQRACETPGLQQAAVMPTLYFYVIIVSYRLWAPVLCSNPVSSCVIFFP